MAPGYCYLCGSIVETSLEAVIKGVKSAKENGADLVEIRLDFLQDFDPALHLRQIISEKELPAIFTFRPKWEGGQYEGDEEYRLDALHLALDLGAEYVDAELEVASNFVQKRREKASSSEGKSFGKVIVSKHNYSITPSSEDLSAMVSSMQSTGADIVKLATTANDITDNGRIFQLLTRVQVPVIALVMGEKGQISRLLAPKFGAFLTFGALEKGKQSAPGQTTLVELSSIFCLRRLRPQTKVLGLIGNPVKHSKGPILHNAVMANGGFDGVYVPFLVDNLQSFLSVFNSPDFAGFSVTIPYKEEALALCDEIEPLAKAIGAVNTLVRLPDGRLKGYNTDCLAAITAIEDGLLKREGVNLAQEAEGVSPLKGRTFVVIGAGGAGRAIAFGAKQRGADVIIANRSVARAKELAAAVGGTAVPVSDVQQESFTEKLLSSSSLAPVLANSTSLGMEPDVDVTPVPAAALSGYSVVFDAVYTPLETRLLREAAAAGATVASGLEMFVRQAEEQLLHFTGMKVSRQELRDIVLNSILKAKPAAAAVA